MMSNVLQLEPAAARAAGEQVEPLEEAVREVSARIAANNAERRRLFARLDELRGMTPSLRRRGPRQPAPELSGPVSLSIEEADAAPAPLQLVRGQG